ncbi:phage FAD/FMN-containing dehydrogenase [Sulfuriferula multivorans]|uniref:Phage FAD/FMN-containing dehydrogenase n=1 Tax=Sulfuriferula multivorans TaxID=1559896 RepID=A0A401JF12_9PROT|nr:phage BR0599 family protein [Sulfuriferula multivorans]GBL46210.1 phage FAD/FMN-containing dehydrogenase [Sulfuriferula multivorans]
MSYNTFETSIHDGQPVELYQFTAGTQAWRYTSADATQIYLSQSFEPREIERGKVGQSPEIAKSKLDLKMPRDNPLVVTLIAAPVQNVLRLDILRKHRTDTEFVTLWRGRVMGIALQGAEATMSCEPIFTSLKRIGLRAVAQRQCRHALYDGGCGVSDSANSASGTLSSVNGAVIDAAVFATQPNGWWVGGKVKFGVDTYRMVVAHTAAQVTLASALPGLAAGQSIVAYPGCDHTPVTCDAKFANIANYGGLPWMPQKNPFAGDSSF